LAVVVTVAKGYDLGYIWKTQDRHVERVTGGYYINAAQAGEPPGRWWGSGAQALGLYPDQVVERQPYDAVYQQIDPRTGAKLGRSRGQYASYAEHLARLKDAEPHATSERLIELEREAAQATRQPAAYTDVTISFSKSISVLHASIRENERRARLAGDRRPPRTGPDGRTHSRRCCTGPTGLRWSICRPGPGLPAPATTAPGLTAASRAGSSPPG
jgi:hypothetical protein